MTEPRLRPSYRLGIYYTDIWSLDISDEVEIKPPDIVPPIPCMFTQRVVVGPPEYKSPFDYLYYKRFAFTRDPLELPSVGLLTYGPSIILAVAIDPNRYARILSKVPLYGVIFEGKEFTRDTYNYELSGKSDYWEERLGYQYINTFPGARTDHPFYNLVRNPPPPGTELEFQLIML